MKNLLKFAAFATVLSMVAFTSSCKDDDDYCYECDAFEDTANGISADAWSGCEGDDDGSGGSFTKADLDLAVAFHEALGGTCNKK